MLASSKMLGGLKMLVNTNPKVGLGSVWNWCGIGLESVWGRFGVGLGSVWSRFGVGLGSVWDQSSITFHP